MSGLGLGGYGSDDEDSRGSDAEAGSHEGGHRPILLDTYHSAGTLGDEHVEDAAPAAARGFNAAPDIQEPSDVPLQEGNDLPQSSGGGTARDLAPSRPASRAPPAPDSTSLLELYLADLPPELRYPPKGKIAEAAEAKLRQLNVRDAAGRTFIECLRQNQQYSNPNFLQQLVGAFELEEKGSAFAKEVFDPAALPREDYLDRLLYELEREQERRKAARAAAPAGQASIAFERGGVVPGMMPASHSAANLQQAQQQAAAQAVARAAAAAVAAGGVGAGALANAQKRTKWDTAK